MGGLVTDQKAGNNFHKNITSLWASCAEQIGFSYLTRAETDFNNSTDLFSFSISPPQICFYLAACYSMGNPSNAQLDQSSLQQSSSDYHGKRSQRPQWFFGRFDENLLLVIAFLSASFLVLVVNKFFFFFLCRAASITSTTFSKV